MRGEEKDIGKTCRMALAFSKIATTLMFVAGAGMKLGLPVTVRLRLNDWRVPQKQNTNNSNKSNFYQYNNKTLKEQTLALSALLGYAAGTPLNAYTCVGVNKISGMSDNGY